ENFDALQVQAWTGLLAIIVLLVVMNWVLPQIVLGRLDFGPPQEEKGTFGGRRARGDLLLEALFRS
ncbi:MAG TPA: hypothetical protein VIT23_12765, partial [Terrimicrobiaceae bacterium]